MATVARNYAQDDVHPLLRHPRPIKRDPAKANRMLGYLADSEEALKGLHREKSVTTRWLERPMYEQREAAEAEEERKQPKAEPIPQIEAKEEPKPVLSLQSVKIIQENGNDDSDSDLLDKWTNPDRPTSSFNPETSLRKLPDAEPISKLDTSFVTQRPLLNTRPASYNPQHLLTPEWTASPSTMGPETASPPRAPSCLESIEKLRSTLSSQDSCECDQPNPVMWSSQLAQKAKDVREERPVSYHPQSFTSLETPAVQQRPRPTSFANYNQRNRSGTKIASSRGLRKDSFPTKSRPPSGTIPKAIAGENIENDQVYQRFGDDEVGPPTPLKSISPAMPPPSVFSATPVTPASSTFDSFDKFEHLEEKPKPEKEKKAKNRWSTIPQALKNFSARRRDSSAASHDIPKFANVVDDLRRLKLTEENLHSYEHEANRFSVAPRRQSTLGLPTPEYSPFDPSTNRSAPQLGAPLPAPFAPWATDAPPSPSATIDYQHRRRSSGLSLSPKPTPLGLRVESPHSPQQQQYHYHNNNQARPSSMHSPRSTPTSAFPSPHHASTFPTQQYHHYTNSPRPTTSDTPRIGTPASRRNTPAVERTCIQCKTTKPNMEFVSRRITGNCWHEPATCAACLHAWITRCAAGAGARGIDACSCPECGEAMSREDVYGLMGSMTGGSPP